MRTSAQLSLSLLALSPLARALPQGSSQSTAVAINPINGLPLPIAASSASAAEPTDTPSITSTNEEEAQQQQQQDQDQEPDSHPSDPTITTAPTLSLFAAPDSNTDSPSSTTDVSNSLSTITDDTTSSSTTDGPELIVWTDTAANTIITMTRVTSTSSLEDDDAHPHHATATVEVTMADGQTELVPTRSVDTFVQGYTGAAAPVGVGMGRGRVWWLVVGGGVGVWGLVGGV